MQNNVTVIPPVIPAESTANKKLRVAAYCRVSTEHDEQQSSIDNQIMYYTKRIHENPGWQFASVYMDRESGTRTKNRKGFNEMIADCKAGKIDLILTKSVSRLARNTVDLLSTCMNSSNSVYKCKWTRKSSIPKTGGYKQR